MEHPFIKGAVAYPAIELLWRGRTHPAMSAAGGISLAAIDRINRSIGGALPRAVAGACAITAVEFAFGAAFNKKRFYTKDWGKGK